MEKVKQAVENRKGPLSYGLDYACKRLESVIAKGIKIDPRFLDRSEKEIADNIKERELLEAWLATFKVECGELKEAEPHIARVEAIFVGLDKALSAVNGQLLVEKAIADRKGKLEYGLNHCLERFNKEISDGFAVDPRFPERAAEKLKKMSKTRDDLTEWLQVFVSTVGQYPEAAVHIAAVEQAIAKFSAATTANEGPQAVQAAIDDRKGPLEYGLDYACKALESTLKDGIVLEERFPERYHEKIAKTTKQRDQLVEWLEKFKAECGKYEAAAPHITRCETILQGLDKLLASCAGKAAVQAAIDDRKGQLEYGLDYACEQLETVLKEGIVLEERFPERYHEKITKTQAQKDKLVEWLAQFTANCGQYEEAKPHIARCEAIFQGLENILGAAEQKGKVQKAIDDRSGPLEYGLDFHLKKLNDGLDSGFEIDPRFPERSAEKLQEMTKARDQLAEWLENFKSVCGTFVEAEPYIAACNEALEKFTRTTAAVVGDQAVRKAIDDRKGPLEYGLDYACKQLEGTITKGLEIDERFPERIEKELADAVQQRDKLAEWLESFRTDCGQYPEAAPHIARAETVINGINTVIDGVEGKVTVQRAIDDRKGPLEYGLDYACKQLEATAKEGIQIDPRFPERATEEVEKTVKRRDQLAEWFENFKSSCGRFKEAEVHMDRCYVLLKDVETLLAGIQGKMAVQQAIDDRKGPLEYGLDFHLKKLNDGLDSGFEIDPRFPERSAEKLQEMTKARDQLAEWLENFKSVCGTFVEAEPYIAACNEALEKFTRTTAAVVGDQAVRKAIDDRKGPLEYGLDYACKQLEGTITKGLEIDERFPERIEKELADAVQQRDKLAEWLESFRTDCGQYPEAAPHIARAETVINGINTVIDGVEGKVTVQRAIANRTGGLEYGLVYHLDKFTGELKQGIEIDPRFPERAFEKVEKLSKMRDQLAEFLESFRAECGKFTESKAHLVACEEALILYGTVTENVVGKLAVQKAVDDRKGPLEYGLDHALKTFSDGLEKGIPDDPRFPEKGQAALDSLRQQKDKLSEWLETFKAQNAQYPEAYSYIASITTTFDKYENVVSQSEGKLRVRAAVEARGVLPYGLDYQLKQLNGELAKGLVLDPRFPERTFQALDKLRTQHDQLREFYEAFQADCGNYQEAKEHLEAIENTTKLFITVTEGVEGTLAVERAVSDRTGSLEYGLDHACKKLEGTLKEGIEIDARFPERGEQKLAVVTQQRDKLAEWLENFRATCGQYKESLVHCARVEDILDGVALLVLRSQGKFMVQRAVNDRTKGLEYGLTHHLDKLNNLLGEGIDIDPRFPERAFERLDKLTKMRDQLAEFLEGFRAECAKYDEAKSYLEACEATLGKFEQVTRAVVGKLAVQKAVDSRTGPLEYGLDHAIKRLDADLKDGIPDDPRFPEKGQAKLDALHQKHDKLNEWLQTFIAECGHFPEAGPYIQSCEKTFESFAAVVSSAEGKLKVRAAIERRGVLPYGLNYQLKGLNDGLQSGLQVDPRFPDLAEQKLTSLTASRDQLVEFLETFRAECGQYEEAVPHIQACEQVLDKFQAVIEPALDGVRVQKLIDARTILPYGLKWQLERLEGVCSSGIPDDARFPERAAEKVTEVSKMRDQLVEFAEAFKAECSPSMLMIAQQHLQSIDSVLSKIAQVTADARLHVWLRAQLNDRSGPLEYGWEYHTNALRNATKQGIPAGVAAQAFVDKHTRMADQLNEWLMCFRGSEMAHIPEVKAYVTNTQQVLDEFNNTVSSAALRMRVEAAIDARNSNVPYGIVYARDQLSAQLAKGLSSDGSSPDRDLIFVNSIQTQSDNIQGWLEGFRAEFVGSDGALPQIAQSEAGRCETVLQQAEVFISSTAGRLKVQSLVNERNPALLEYGLNHALEALNTILNEGVVVDPRFPESVHAKVAKAQNIRDRIAEFAEKLRAEATSSDGVLVAEAQVPLQAIEESLRKFDLVVGTARIRLEVSKRVTDRTGPLPYGLHYHLDMMNSALDKGLPTGDAVALGQAIEKAAAANDRLLEWTESFRTEFNVVGSPEVDEVLRLCNAASEKHTRVVGASYALLQAKKAKAEAGGLQHSLSYHLGLLNRQLDAGPVNDEHFPERDQKWADDCELLKNQLSEWLCGYVAAVGDISTLSNDPALEEIRQTTAEVEGVLAKAEQVLGAIATQLLLKKFVNAKDDRLDKQTIAFVLSSLEQLLSRGFNEATPDRAINDATKLKDSVVEWFDEFRVRFVGNEGFVRLWVDRCEKVLKSYDEVVGASAARLLIKRLRNARKSEDSACCLAYGLEWQLNHLLSGLARIPSADKLSGASLQAVVEPLTQERDLLVEWLEWFRAETANFNVAAQPTIQDVNAALDKYEATLGAIWAPVSVGKALEARSTDNNAAFASPLEHGFEFHYAQLQAQLKAAAPSEARPLKDWIKTASQRRQQLEAFAANLTAEFFASPAAWALAKTTVDKCNALFVDYDSSVGPLQLRLLVASYRTAKKGEKPGAGLLPHGFDYEIQYLSGALNKDQSGAVNIAAASASADRLAEWLEIVRGEVAKYPASTVSQCQLWLESQQHAERVLKQFDSIVAPVTIPQAVAKFIKKGGALAAGLDFHIQRLNAAAPSEEKVKIHVGKSCLTPAAVTQFSQDANELRAFLETFRANFGKYQATVVEVDTVIQRVSNALVAFDASVGLNSLEIELKHFLEKWSSAAPLPRPLKYFLDLFDSRLAIPLGPEIVVQGSCTMKGLADLLIDFQERFQSRFGHALEISELARTTNSQLANSLQKWQDQQPYLFQQTKLALKRQRKAGPKPASEQPEAASVEEEVKNDLEDEVPQSQVASDAKAGEEDYYVAAWTMDYVQSRGIGAADVGPRHVTVWEAEEQLVEPPPAMEDIDVWLAQPLTEPPPAELKELPLLVPFLSHDEVIAAKEWVKNNTEITVDPSGPNGFLASLIADLPKKSQALASTLKLEEFNATNKLSAELEITVDVSFLSQASYTDIKDDAERKKVAQAVPVSLLSRFLTSSDGIVGFCNKPPVTRLLFLSRVRQIVLGYGGSKSAGSNSPADKQFIASTPVPGVLLITFSMKGYDAIDPKPLLVNLDNSLGFTIPKAIAALRAKLELTGKTLSTRLKRTASPIVVTMDLEKFMAEISKLAEANQLPQLMRDPKEQVIAAERMVAACNSIVVGTPQSIADQCSKVQPLNNRVFTTLRHIEFVADTTNTVTCGVGILEPSDSREKGLHLRLRFDEARGVLEITGRYGMLYEACKNKPVEAETLNVGEKAEGAWTRVSALKCMQAGAPKMKGYSGLAKRELGGKNVEYCAAWHEWVDDPTFLQFIPSEQQIASNFLINGHMSRSTNGADGLFSVWRRGPNIQNAIKSKLDRMVFAFFPNDGPTPGRQNPNMGEYKILFDYHTRTMYIRGKLTAPEWVQAGGKRFRAPAPEYKGWACTNVRFWQLFEVIDERIRGEKKVWGLKKRFAPIDFFVQYDDFFNNDDYLSNNQRVEITRRVADEHLAAVRRCVTDCWGTRIGREALLKQVKRIVIKFGSSYSWKLNKEAQEWVLNVPYSQLLYANNASSLVKPWQLRWDLGVAVEVAVATAEKVAAKHHRECEKLCRKKFDLQFDWSAVIQRTADGVFYNDPSLSPEQIIETIVQFGEQLTQRVMLGGLAALMSCPASAAVVEKTIQTLRFVLVSTSQKCSPLKIISLADDKHTIVATVDANNVHFGTMTERFQEVLEWHYDVLHACNAYKVDKFRAETAKIVQQECKISPAGELLSVNWSEFLTTPEFHTDLHPPKQADIIMALHAHLPTITLTAAPTVAEPSLDSFYKHATNPKAMKSLAEQLLLTGRKQKTVKVIREGGMISLVCHPCNLAAVRQFNPKTPFFSIRVVTQKGANIPTEGMLLVENGGFVLVLHLDNVLSCLCVDNWRERFASALGTLEATFSAENDEPFAFAKSQVIAKLKAPKLQITSDWSLLHSHPAYMALHPTARIGIIIKYHNNMATSSLLGDSGLTGEFSISEHSEVAQAIVKAVDTIVFRVVPLESKELEFVQYEKSSKTLTINYAFMQPLFQSTYIMQGAGYAIEKVLDLYPLRLKSMAAAAEKRLAKEVWPVQDKQHKVSFTIDWESFATCDGAFPVYGPHKLCAYWSERVRSVAKCIEDCITFKPRVPDGEGWGCVSISAVLSETANPNFCKMFDEKCPKGILFRGCEQRIPRRYGRTYFTPRSLDVAVKDGYLVLTQDPSRTGQYGAGRMLEFGIRGTEVMQAEEDKVRTRLAAYQRDYEKDRRRQENEHRRRKCLLPIDFGPFPDYYENYGLMSEYRRYDEPCLFAIMDSTEHYRWTVGEMGSAVEWGPERYDHASEWRDSRLANMSNRVAGMCQFLDVSNDFVKKRRQEKIEEAQRKEREALKEKEKEAQVERRRQEKIERAARFAESNPFDQKTDPLAYKYWDV